jgi:ABC-type phosphate transport system substrate-binding protein
MRAHTIATEARAEARARTKRTILALSLAVALLAATASTASTTATPAAPPLTLDARSSAGEASRIRSSGSTPPPATTPRWWP